MGAFQWIFDAAETISIDKRPMVAQTITRSNVIRATSYGGPLWKFEVKLPDGLPWSEYRSRIELAEGLDRHTTSTIQINNAGYNNWLTAYQGNSVNYTGFLATWTQGNTYCTLTTSPTTSSGYKFRAGDILQLNTGHVYTVASDVSYTGANANRVDLNKAIIDATVTTPAALFVGPNVTWTVICKEFPNWTIMDKNIVSFNGPFIFYEAL